MMMASHRIGRQQPFVGNVRYIALAEERGFLTILYVFNYFLVHIRGEDFCVLSVVVY